MTAAEEKVVGWYIFWKSIYRFYSPHYDLKERARIYIKNITKGAKSDKLPAYILDEMWDEIGRMPESFPYNTIDSFIDANPGQEDIVAFYLSARNKRHSENVNLWEIIRRIINNNYEPLFKDPNYAYDGYTMIQEPSEVEYKTFSILGIDFRESDEMILQKVKASLEFYREYILGLKNPLSNEDLVYDNFAKTIIYDEDYTTTGYSQLQLAMARSNKFQIRTNGKRCAGIYLYCMRHEIESWEDRSLSEVRYLLRNGTFENQSLMDIFGLPYDIDDRQLDRYYSNAKACIEKGEVLPITG